MTLQATSNKFQVLHFSVQKIHVCIPLQYIEKVLPLMELKRIPGTPNYCAGLMNISGISIPVIDLAIRLNLKRTDKYTLSTPIILCHERSREMGLITDEILGLIQVDNNSLQLQNNFNEKVSPFEGVINIDSHLALVLNIPYILSSNLTSGIDNSSFDINTMNLTGFRYE
jgi:purine-binding chemotaxis protein CheW